MGADARRPCTRESNLDCLTHDGGLTHCDQGVADAVAQAVANVQHVCTKCGYIAVTHSVTTEQIVAKAVRERDERDGPLLSCPWCQADQTGKIIEAQLSHLIECGDRQRAQQAEEIARLKEQIAHWKRLLKAP
jgi:hypothetical protein